MAEGFPDLTAAAEDNALLIFATAEIEGPFSGCGGGFPAAAEDSTASATATTTGLHGPTTSPLAALKENPSGRTPDSGVPHGSWESLPEEGKGSSEGELRDLA